MAKKLLLGNAAVARGAYEAGVRVVSSYPGTPSTEITENIVQYDEIFCEWAPNEKVACEVALGAAIGGARAMSCMKHVGLNVMADPVFTASYTGINGGLVLAVADDQGLHSSQNEQDSRHYARASKMPMLEPSDSQECKDFTKAAYELSELFDTPVFLRLSTRVSHSQSPVSFEDRADVPLKDYEKDYHKYAMLPASATKAHVKVEERTKKIAEYAETSPLNRIEDNSSKVGVICAGIAYDYALEAFGDRVDYLKLGIVWPLPIEKIKAFAASHETLAVIEELDPFIEDICRAAGVRVDIGKDRLTMLGEYTPTMLKKAVFNEEAPELLCADERIPPRPPVMCAGCPHRGAFHVLAKLGLTVSGDIGCYALGAVAPLNAVDTTVCMGASVSGAHGMALARGKEFNKKLVAVIGDSTFMHSGITGLIDMVYNKGAGTVIILDNSITGMTGHQDNPTTGYTIRGEVTKQVNLITLCHGIGVEHVVVVDPFDIKEFERVVKEETARDDVSVIISQRPCALLKRVKYTGRYAINTEKCRNCKMCMKIGCPAITVHTEGVRIEAHQCVGCGLCENVCPFGAIERVED